MTLNAILSHSNEVKEKYSPDIIQGQDEALQYACSLRAIIPDRDAISQMYLCILVLYLKDPIPNVFNREGDFNTTNPGSVHWRGTINEVICYS